MIGEVIQATLQGIIPNTYSSVGDEGISLPFCIHSESDIPLDLKEGIAGYTWSCDIALVHSTPDQVETLAMQVKTAFEALSGSTVNATIIETVAYEGSDQGFDETSRSYMKTLQFIINTKNR